MSMKTSYSERDYSFGQAMLTLRTAIGLTQGALAHYLGVSRRAVGDWEAGSSSPIQAPPASRPRVDWGDALAIPAFYGREEEQVQLIQWIVEERCRVVS